MNYPVPQLGKRATYYTRPRPCICADENLSKRTTTDHIGHIQTATDRAPKRNDNEKFLEIQKIDREIQTMSRPRYTTGTSTKNTGTEWHKNRHQSCNCT